MFIETETPFSSIGNPGERVAYEALLLLTVAVDGASGTLALMTPNSPAAIPPATNGVGDPVGLTDGDGDGDGLGEGDGLPLGVGVGDDTVTGMKLAPVNKVTVPFDSLLSFGDN